MASQEDEAAANPPFIRVRLIDLQINLSPPVPQLREAYKPPNTGSTSFPTGQLPRRVPIIRIFGTTPANQKMCVNIHGVWPYLFVDYPEDMSLSPETVHKYTHRFALSLNQTIRTSLRQQEFAGPSRTAGGGDVNTAHLHVASVVLVKGVPFYGHHVGYKYYLKISLVSPSMIGRATGILQSGKFMGRKFTVYESHLAAKLQFMIDYDLYGCGWLDLDGGTFREPIPAGDRFETPEIQAGLHNDLTIPLSNRYEHPPPRETYAELELDVLPWQVINRRRLEPRYLHDSLRELLHPESIDHDEKLVRSMRELWAEENRRRVSKGLPELDSQSQGIDGSGIRRISLSQDDRAWKGGDWDASERFWEGLQARVQTEKRLKGYEGRMSLEKLGQPSVLKGHSEWDRFIMTTFESVETGWPKNINTPRRTVSQRSKRPPPSSPIKPKPQDSTQPIMADGESDSESVVSEANPFELGPGSQEVPPLAEEVNVADEELIRAFQESEGLDEILENERLVQAELEGWRLPLEYTPKKGEAPWEDYVKSQEEIEEEDGLEQHLSQMGRKRAEERGLSTPMRPSHRARMSSMTPRGNPSTFSLRPFASSSVAPRKNGIGSVNGNPYIRPGPGLRYGTAQKTTPGKSPLNPFTRTTSPSITPTKRSRGGNALSTPAKLLPREDSASPSPSAGRQSDQDVDSEDWGDEIDIPPTLLFGNHAKAPVARRMDENDAVPREADSERPNLPLSEHAGTMVVEPEPPPHRGVRSAMHAPISPSVDQLAPTLLNPGQLPRPVSTKSSTNGTTPASLASTLVSSHKTDSGVGPRPSKRVRIAEGLPTSQNRSDISISKPVTEPSTSLTSDSIKSDSIPVELLESGAWRFAVPPPSRAQAAESLKAHGMPAIIYQKPFFSRPSDVGKGPMQFGTSCIWVKSNAVMDLPEFEFPGSSEASRVRLKSVELRHGCHWTYAAPPPARKVVQTWLRREVQVESDKERATRMQVQAASQFGGPTQANSFANSRQKKNSNAQRERQNMSCMSLEVFATSKGKLLPNPQSDPIVAVFYCLQDEVTDMEEHPEYPGRPFCYTGIFMVKDKALDLRRIGHPNTVNVEYFDSELDLINEVVNRVKHWDPDVLAGWEVHASSWGYLVDRAGAEFGFVLSDDLSRVIATQSGPRNDRYSAHHTSSFKVIGRHVFNIWRILRGDLNLLQYSFENVTFQLLHQRFPHYSPWTLTEWYRSKYPEHVTRLLRYYIDKVNMYVEMMDQAEIVTKNAEFARVFGVDFNSVMSRGSQFKVESFMFRIAKPESFVLISPTRDEVGKQNAAEAQPLIFEPQSVFYNDPVVVLDFQSLYPSIMIGYNYCYSTCLGRVESFMGSQKLGWTDMVLPPGRLELLQDHITISPNGIIYAKQNLRKSLLSKMLGEILETRVMVKNGMKLARGDKSLLQVLNARQLGLKLMANVTYGYTGASFSGRMPCVEIADSIVQTGRETLEKAITFIQSKPEWNANVVYGDTDSLFVHMPGRSREQAHKLGNEIADAVTALNPKPVKLKFEKVYSASLLMAKKRYVGFKHENIDDIEPTFDAKGIETVRRDGFPAGQKMVETCIKMLFRTQDISKIKDYCQAQWSKLREGKVSIQDFTLAKEVKLGSYSDKGPPPPGAFLAARKLTLDPRAEAEYGERVPYVITMAEKTRLVDRAMPPEALLNRRDLKLDPEFYITRHFIPALNRVFNLVGIDVGVWYDQMPKRHLASAQYQNALEAYGGGGDGRVVARNGQKDKGKTLDMHFASLHCLVCGVKTDKKAVCSSCRSDLPSSVHTLMSRYHLANSRLQSAHRICASCSSTPLAEPQRCDSLDCPVLYARVKAGWEADDVRAIPGLVAELERDAERGDEVIEID